MTVITTRPPEPALDARALAQACERAVEELAREADDRTAVDAALRLVHRAFADRVLVSLFVLEHGRLWLVAQCGYHFVPDGIPLDRGVVARAARTGETQFLARVGDDPDYVVGAAGVVSELAVLAAAEPVCAVFNVETRQSLPREAVPSLERLALALGQRVAALSGSAEPDLSTLARLFVHASTLRDTGAIGELAARTLARLLDLDGAQVNLGAPGRRRALAATWSARHTDLDPVPFETVEALARAVDRSAVVDVLPFAGTAPEVAERTGLTTAAWLPLRASGVEIGVLLGYGSRPIALDRGRAELCALLAAHVAASLDAAELLARERRAALTDPLTGVLNRRGLDERLADELARANRDGAPCSVLVLDMDDFKEVNDLGGHEVGDRVLSTVGRYLRGAKRSWDIAARLGGDEFVLVLAGAGTVAARAAAARLRGGLRETLQRSGHSLSLSLGIATFPEDGRSPAELLRAADRAMYRAKRRGRDGTLSFAELQREDRAHAEGARVIHLPVRPAPRPVTTPRAAGDGVLGDVAALAAAAVEVGRAPTGEEVLAAGARELTQLLGAAATSVSRLEGDLLVDVLDYEVMPLAVHGDEPVYDLADYPFTRAILESGVARGVSVGDDGADAGEVFVLRQLGMQAVLIVPLLTGRGPWGLVEVYDARPRRFGEVDTAVAEFLVGQMASRLDALEHPPGAASHPHGALSSEH